ncbi:regulatory protein GemA [Undibacterium sp. 14-3-2]|jgi:phage gp16-like protein|uniref:gp16 family protein n=1 Tax=Undibacterium sp. 14-3-2 TaxID=2800129 RepID=UPI001907B9ED|nr:regulatory protein GemA [Undibacterium sp. 14-3-2]MBK1890699.1 regulatory protein GemA [Undibacterium sp. 14-3-2]
MKNRTQYIQLIHIAKSQLGLDDDVYRSMLTGLELPNSTTKMSVPELQKVLDHLKRSGFKVRSKPKDRSQDDSEQAKMLRALWLELSGLGYVRDPSEKALAAWVKRETGVAALQWLNVETTQKTIEKLKQWRWRDEQKIKKMASQLCRQGHLATSDIHVLSKEWFQTTNITKQVSAQMLQKLKQFKEVTHGK